MAAGDEASMRMYDRILVPTDGSKGTTRSLEHAAAIARNNDATVHVLYVVDQRLYRAASKDTKDEVIASLEEEGEHALDDAVTRLEENGVEVVTVRREGIPYKSILAYTEDEAMDLVVMGTHGRTGRDRIATLGSVTERVVKNADVPVLVVDIAEE
jgi:nucleotide-binding universal stress UspA family protein